MLSYFDLNKSLGGDSIQTMKVLSAESALEDKSGLPVSKQALMYAGLFIGVIFSAAVRDLEAGGSASFNVDSSALLVSAVIALMLVPMVYKNLRLSAKTPFVAQFGLFVQHGVFWNVLIDSLGKLIK